MSALAAAEPNPSDPCLVDPVGVVLEGIGRRLGVSCLLESRDGAIVSHALSHPPVPSVASAVLGRTSAPLHDAAKRRRTAAVLPGGAVTSLSLPGWRGTTLVTPVIAGGAGLGWLWILAPSPGQPDVEALAKASAEVAHATCGLLLPEGRELFEALRTSSRTAPTVLLGRPSEQVWVAGITADGAPSRVVCGALALALRAEPSEMARSIAAGEGAVYLVIGTTKGASAVCVQQAVEAVMARAGDLKLSAVLARPVTATENLPQARAQVDAAVTVGVPGRCLRLDEARPRVVLSRLFDALIALPDLGPDPLQPLLDYDAKRGGDFAHTLLAWLDSNGDVPVAADLLGIHHNTLRYRIARAQQVLPVDLACLAARLEIHLRLRALATRRQSSSG